MRAARLRAKLGGRGADTKSSQLRIPDRQSRSSVRYPTPGMWTKVSRSIRIGDPPPGDSRCAEVGEPRKVLIRDARWPHVFEVRERDGLGRIGVLETAHGPVTTPALLPVVNPNRPVIAPSDLASRFGAEILITNAYILGKSPRREAILRDGVHSVLEFPRAIVTDSGAFQSHVYGDVDVTNPDIVAFQKSIGSDFGTMLDVFSEPGHDHARAEADVQETIRRAKEAESLRGGMALVGAVQGGLHADLRERCAKAVHLFGAGHPLIFPLAILLGCDLFDSASYAKYARDGRMLFPVGNRRASEVRESGC